MSHLKSKQTNFRAENRFSLSYDTLNTMRRKNEFCDAQFVIRGTKISAHKIILASNSDYFKKIFNENLNDSKLLNIEILNTEITPYSFELLIDFLYTSELSINYYNVQELLITSSFLMLDDVKKECLKYIEETINIENFMTIKKIADMNKMKDLNQIFLSYILKNYDDIVESTTFLSFPIELMMELIDSNELNAQEEKAFESSMMWLKHDLKERLKYLPKLFKAIRLCLMSIDYLDNTVQEEDLIKSDVACLSYFCDAYKKIHKQLYDKSRKNYDFDLNRRKYTQELQEEDETDVEDESNGLKD